jgi:hypothetical protein
MSEYFSNVFPKFFLFYFVISLQFLAYEFHFPTKFLYRSFVFEHYCTSKFVMFFLHVYVLYIILYLNNYITFNLA